MKIEGDIRMLKDTVIYTERLKERPINSEDFDTLYENYDKDAEFYMDLFKAGNKESAMNFIKQCIKELNEETDLNMIICDRITNKFIGYLGIYYIGKEDPELGLWINKDSQHKGYGMEAIESAIKWLRENCQFSHIRCPIDKKNIYSRKIPEHFKGEIKKEYTLKSCTGRRLDIVEYWIEK